MVKKRYKRVLFVFRRDLRLQDNSGLNSAAAQAQEIMPCFIFDPRQVTTDNDYRTHNGIQFMITSLNELNQALHDKNGHLYLFYGIAHEVIDELIKKACVEAVFVNEDYTPFSRIRDEHIRRVCSDSGIDFLSHKDLLLTDLAMMTKSIKPYRLFTPFYKQALQMPVPLPKTAGLCHYVNQDFQTRCSISFRQVTTFEWGNYHNALLFKKGGRREGLSILASLGNFRDYDTTHDFPAFSTTGLSAHNKFGTLSIREVYHAILRTLGNGSLIRQLYWRDFFTYIGYHFPHVFGHAFTSTLDSLAWSSDRDAFKRWCTGMTGFPIVDAGMRQLNETGFMHNRVRLVVASFLVKDLHIDWRWGECYFANQLEDYDAAVNNGNWQWVASTGCDKQPYFRVFNPWLQQKKYDRACSYIKKWIPELKDISPIIIATWYKQKSNFKTGYPLPMLDHGREAQYAKKLFKRKAR